MSDEFDTILSEEEKKEARINASTEKYLNDIKKQISVCFEASKKKYSQSQERRVLSEKEIMEGVYNGELLRPDGSRFPADMDFGDFVAELCKRQKTLQKAKDNLETAKNTLDAEAAPAEAYLKRLRDTLPMLYGSFKNYKQYKDTQDIILELINKTANEITVDDTRKLYETQNALYELSKSNMLINNEGGKGFIGIYIPAESGKAITVNNSVSAADLGFSIAESQACNDIQTSILELYAELKNSDKFIMDFKNSSQFKLLKSGLKTLAEAVKNPKTKLSELRQLIDNKDANGKTVLDYADDYLNAKRQQTDDLSSRQLSRMNICTGLKKISSVLDDAQGKIKKQPGIKKDLGCLKEITIDKIIHKNLKAQLMEKKTSVVNMVYKTPEIYEKAVSELKKVGNIKDLSKKDLGQLNKISRKASADVRKDLKTARQSFSQEAYDNAVASFSGKIKELKENNKVDDNTLNLCSFLKDRTAKIYTQHIAHVYSWFHGEAFRELDICIDNIDIDLLGTASKLKNVSDIHKVFERSLFPLKQYQMEHQNDDPYFADEERIGRLQAATELQLCENYLRKEDPKLRGLLENLYAHHCMSEEYLRNNYLNAINRQDSYLTADRKDISDGFEALTDFEKYNEKLEEFKNNALFKNAVEKMTDEELKAEIKKLPNKNAEWRKIAKEKTNQKAETVSKIKEEKLLVDDGSAMIPQ